MAPSDLQFNSRFFDKGFRTTWREAREEAQPRFLKLIEAAFIVAWDDPCLDQAHIAGWNDECLIELALAPPGADPRTLNVITLHGRRLAFRRDMVSAIVDNYGPLFATELDFKGTPLANQQGAEHFEIDRPQEPTAHEKIIAAEMISDALRDVGHTHEEILRLIAGHAGPGKAR
jgi:hypothetical protein